MKNIFTILSLLCVILCTSAFAQDDMMSMLDAETPKQKEYAKNAFKSSRVINCHSMEMIAKKSLDFRILHRFGNIKPGIYDLFGLDQASMRMGFDYGLTKNLTIGIGRSTLNKEIDGFVKYRMLWQGVNGGSPVSIVLIAGTTLKTIRFADPTRKNYFTSRLGYYYQVIVGRKFNENFSLQLTPTLVHRNIIEKKDDSNDIYAVSVGGRYKVTKRLAVLADYSQIMNGYPAKLNQNPLSLGVDIETGGHVFQLHVSNTRGLNERAFITETTNDFFKGNMFFGFNLSRMF